MTDNDFVQNRAGTSGGALSLDTGTIVNGLIADNQTAGFGGGVNATGLLILQGTVVSGNTAVGNGGGISSNSNALLTNVTVRDNESTGGSGGGVWGNSDAVLTDTQVLSNTAVLDGGGVYARLGFNSHLTRVRLVNNAAGRNGGGLYAARRVQSDDSFWIGNTAVRGGAIAITGTSGTTPMTFTNSVLSRNAATVSGGAIYLNTPRPFVLHHATMSADVMRPEEAVFIAVGDVRVVNTIVSSYSVGIENVGGTLTTTHNLFNNSGSAIVGSFTDVGSRRGVPNFVDASRDLLGLQAGSLALDTAVDIGVPADVTGLSRPQGSAPDMGAYEGEYGPLAVTLGSVSVSGEGGESVFWLVGLVVLLVLTTAVFKRPNRA